MFIPFLNVFAVAPVALANKCMVGGGVETKVAASAAALNVGYVLTTPSEVKKPHGWP
jgi:hypothetical protein